MMGMAEVVRLKENEVFEDIKLFFREKANFNKDTAKSYERDIRDFFQIVVQKDLEFLTIDNLKLKKNQIEMFRSELIQKDYDNKTINKKVNSLKMLLLNLEANEYPIKTTYFKAIRKLPEKKNRYGILSFPEVVQMATLAATKERNLRKVKSLLILFAVDTCVRKSAILELTWKDFEVQDNDEVFIHGIDKGDKEYRCRIKKGFYDELLTLKEDGVDKVFNISKSSVDEMIPRLVKLMNIPPERNIVFHSIRKAGITFQYRATGDIKAAQRAANHSDASLTIGTYIDDVDHGNFGAYSSQSNVDDNILDTLTLEQWQELARKANKEQQLYLKLKAKELYSK